MAKSRDRDHNKLNYTQDRSKARKHFFAGSPELTSLLATVNITVGGEIGYQAGYTQAFPFSFDR